MNNIHIFREEIQRIKANNPEISHREAFSTAAKNVSGKYIVETFIAVCSQTFWAMTCKLSVV